MEVIKFNKMVHLDYHLKHLFAMDQKWSENQVFSMWNAPRKTSAFLYFKNSGAVYTLPDGTDFSVKKGEMVYIPQGARYKTRFVGCAGEVQAQLIEFELVTDAFVPFAASPGILILALPKHYDLDEIFDEIVAIHNKPVLSYSAMKSRLYAFLDEICESFHEKRMYSKKYLPIAEGIAYLEERRSYELSVAEIAKMCHVSESCFRKLFEQYAGFSPMRYKTNNLLRQAKGMLRSGDLTISEIASRLGFEDVAYFSRWFKKNTGLSPSRFEEGV